jgi:hypothetical protein
MGHSGSSPGASRKTRPSRRRDRRDRRPGRARAPSAQDYPHEPKLDIDAKTYRADAVSRCPELSICRQLSIGWKHSVVELRNNPDVQALHVVDIYVKTKDGLPVDGARPTYSRQRPAIYNGTKSIALDAFFEHVTRFWSMELDRLNFGPAFTV